MTWNRALGKVDIEVTYADLRLIAIDVINTVLAKNADYGGAWQRQGIAGVMARLSDKLCRVETLADGREALVADEKLKDTLMDVIGYAMLGLLYLENTK